MNTFEICYNDAINNGVQYVRFGRKDISPIAPLLADEISDTRARHIQRPTEKTGEAYDEMLDERIDVMTTVPDKYLKWDGALVAQTTAERAERDVYDAMIAEEERLAQPIPEITPLQFRLVLLSQGITEAQIDSLLDAIVDPSEKAVALLTWNKASIFKRDHPMIVSMGATMGFTELQMDELFRTASEIE